MRMYTENDIRNFYSHVAVGKPDECWSWIGATDDYGYGRFSFHGKTTTAHRFAYWFSTGIDPEELFVCHSCDNPPCVNPAHLWLGTPKDNIRDAQQKGRLVGNYTRGEARAGSTKLTEADVREIRSKHASGQRTYVEMMREYGISKRTLCNVISRERWGHVQ